MTIASQTFQCGSVVPSREQCSSRDLNWTSLLLDIHSGVTSHEPYTAIATPDFRIGVTLSGRFSCEAFARGRWRHAEHGPGSIMLHRTKELTRYRFPKPKDESYRLALIYLPIALIEECFDEFRRLGAPSSLPAFDSSVVRDAAITEVARALSNALQRGHDELYAESAATWLATHLCANHATGEGGSVRQSGTITDARLARVMEYMSAHLGEPLQLDQLAAEACISKFHFSRLFTAKVGLSPYRYLTEIRLDTALSLLATTELPIGEIGRTCGYPVAARFSSAFAARYGESPAQFRSRR